MPNFQSNSRLCTSVVTLTLFFVNLPNMVIASLITPAKTIFFVATKPCRFGQLFHEVIQENRLLV